MADKKAIDFTEKGTAVDTDLFLSADPTTGERFRSTILEFYNNYLKPLITLSFIVNGGVLPPNTTIGKKEIFIGEWDMDFSATNSIEHGIADYKKIRYVETAIRSDSNTDYLPLDTAYSSTGVVDPNLDRAGCVLGWDATHIFYYRRDGFIFDSTDYNDNSIERGYSIIGYVL